MQVYGTLTSTLLGGFLGASLGTINAGVGQISLQINKLWRFAEVTRRDL
jgi:hypothetical protein